MSSAFLTALKKRRRPTLEIHVPEWDTTIVLHKLTARQRLDLLGKSQEMKRDATGKIEDTSDAIEFGVELLAVSVRDSAGNLLFDSDEGRQFLAEEDFDVLQKLSDAALALNQLGAAPAKSKKSKKN